MFVIAGMGLQERLALKAALNFMVKYIKINHRLVASTIHIKIF